MRFLSFLRGSSRWMLFFTLSLLIWHCGPPVDPPDEGCQTSSECPSGQKCRSRKCVVPSNIKPSADAGSDQTVQINEKVLLSARNSFDEDGDKLKFSWSFSSKPKDSQAKLTGSDQDESSFTPDKAGKYVLLVKVSDSKDSGQDEVTITAEKGKNFEPEAKVGENRSVPVGATVKLDGSKSSDANQDPLKFKWALKVPTGSQAKLDDDSKSTATFVADVEGDYEATLAVNDGEADSKPAIVKIKAVKGFDKEPKITSLDPTKGPTDSTIDVKIIGSQFVEKAVVLFRNRELTTTYANEGELKVKLDLSGVAAGKYPLSVKNPNEKTSTAVDFEVIEVPTPVIATLTPNKAGQNSKFVMKVAGTGFVQSSKVFFNGRFPATTFKSDTLLEVQVDLVGTAQGQYPVTIQNPGGKNSNSVNFEVTPPPPPPEITIIDPEEGKSGSKIDFKVFGKRFDQNSIILFDGKPIPTKHPTAGELHADPKLDLSSIPAGTYKIKVRDQFGIESKEETFTVLDQYPTPQIAILQPPSSTTGAPVKVVISGKFFDAKAVPFFNNKAVAKYTYKSSSQIEMELDLTTVTPTKYDVYVENPGPSGGPVRKSNAVQFEVKPLPAPTISSTVTSGLYSNTQGAILVNGKGFTPAAVVQTVTRGQYSSSTTYCARGTFVDRSTTYISPTQLLVRFVVPSTTSSSYRYHGIRVKRGSLTSNTLCFYVSYSGSAPLPAIKSLSPVAVAAGTKSPVTVKINGSGFDRFATVSFNKKALKSTKYISTTVLEAQFDITGLVAGSSADVQVESSTGKKTGIVKFSILKPGQPVLQSISPSIVYAGSTYTFVLKGTGFDPKAVVHADGKLISGTTSFVNATQMTVTGFTVPPGTKGSISVTVVNPNNVKSNPIAVSMQLFPTPILTSVSPTSAYNGSTISYLYAYGKNFRAKTTTGNGSMFYIDGKSFPYSYRNSSYLRLNYPTLKKCPLAPISIQILNPDGQLSNAKTITLNPSRTPSLSSISPSIAVNNQILKLRVSGSYLGQSHTLLFGKDVYKSTTSTTNTSYLYFEVDMKKYKQGIYPVKIRYDNCGTTLDSSQVINFTVVDPPTPAITYFSPMLGETTKKVTVTITGKDFNPGSLVLFDGKSQTISSRSTTSLKFELDLTTVKVAQYTLQVDNGGGKKSEVVNFNVVDVSAPVITKINPAAVNHTSSTTTITIEGRNFHPNATVSLKGSTLGLSSRSSTKLVFSTVFPSQLYPHNSKNEVKVTNPDGKSASVFLHVYDARHPIIRYLNPTTSGVNRSIYLYVYGTYLYSGSAIYFDGKKQSTRYYSSYVRTYSSFTTGATARVMKVYVTVSGKTSNTVDFFIGAVTPPLVAYMTPPYAKAGTSVTLNLRGSSFATSPFGKVYFAGKAYTPTGSSSSLTVTIPSTEITAGVKEVYVQNSAGKVSRKILFTVTP